MKERKEDQQESMRLKRENLVFALIVYEKICISSIYSTSHFYFNKPLYMKQNRGSLRKHIISLKKYLVLD